MPDELSDDGTNDPESEAGEEEEFDPAEIKDSGNKALIEFRCKVEEAIRGGYLIAEKRNIDMTLWGVPLLPSSGHEGTDVVLIKFLRAKHYKVEKAFKMLRRTLKWRLNFQPEKGIDGTYLDSSWFASGRDNEGRPLCYSVLGEEFQNKLLAPGYVDKCQDYFRWRVLCVEKGIQNLCLRPGGVDSFIQILDLRNANSIAMKEVKLICKKMIHLLNDHYPGIVYKNLIINVPSWFLTLNALNLRLITQRSKNRFIFVRPSRITRSLLQYATVENILNHYGGLKREKDIEFSSVDKVREVNIRANAKDCIEIPVNEAGVTVTWDLTVVGYEVAYREEFVPDDDCSYRILLQEKKMAESTRNTFYIRETGKIVITIMNGSYTKKKAFYRYKSRPFVPMYMLSK